MYSEQPFTTSVIAYTDLKVNSQLFVSLRSCSFKKHMYDNLSFIHSNYIVLFTAGLEYVERRLC